MMTIPYCSSVNLFYAPAVLGKKENELNAVKVIYGPDGGWDEGGPLCPPKTVHVSLFRHQQFPFCSCTCTF
jgi:hypothetical protein